MSDSVCGLSTKSPVTKVFSFTLRFDMLVDFQPLSVYPVPTNPLTLPLLGCIWLSASLLRDSASVGLYMAFSVVIVLLNSISFGITASSPNNTFNEVKLVTLETEVSWLQAFGSSSTHFPFC
jgi:hypothetical protein